MRKLRKNPLGLRLSTETLRALSQSQLVEASVAGATGSASAFMLCRCCSIPDGQ
jgi:hypothetical protein